MRRLLLGIAASATVLGQSGCLINIYSADPNRRVLELLNQSKLEAAGQLQRHYQMLMWEGGILIASLTALRKYFAIAVAKTFVGSWP